MWITTGYDPNEAVVREAKHWAVRLNGTYIPRKKRSIRRLMEEKKMDALLVVSRELPKLFMAGQDQPLFFHPGVSIPRIKLLQKGENDLLIDLAELQPGDSFLDCTLGFGGDSIVASYVVGPEGRVVGIESQKVIAELTADGLRRWPAEDPEIQEAMKRIEVVHDHHLDVLKRLPDRSFDVVYFDPMFREGIKESPGISPLRAVANMAPLTKEAVFHALRVCRRKVIMKERTHSPEFARLGFRKLERGSASVTYGVIEKESHE